ncbi:MAG: MarR family transcriptional regulator [Rudanella sp.]|nr:MarR family transcriptional regulator [Rudanella sp.]
MSIESDIRQTAFNSSYHRLLVNVLYSSNWLGNAQMQLLKPFGITSQQFNFLRILRGRFPDPVKVNEITERMLDKMSNASRLVDKLLLKKLVERTECPSDRRAVNVIINQKGLDLLTKIDAAQLQFEGIMEQRLTIEEADTLSHLLDQLRGSELAQTAEEEVYGVEQ